MRLLTIVIASAAAFALGYVVADNRRVDFAVRAERPPTRHTSSPSKPISTPGSNLSRVQARDKAIQRVLGSLPPFLVAFAEGDVEDILRVIAAMDNDVLRDEAVGCLYRHWQRTATEDKLSGTAERLVAVLTRCPDAAVRAVAWDLFLLDGETDDEDRILEPRVPTIEGALAVAGATDAAAVLEALRPYASELGAWDEAVSSAISGSADAETLARLASIDPGHAEEVRARASALLPSFPPGAERRKVIALAAGSVLGQNSLYELWRAASADAMLRRDVTGVIAAHVPVPQFRRVSPEESVRARRYLRDVYAGALADDASLRAALVRAGYWKHGAWSASDPQDADFLRSLAAVEPSPALRRDLHALADLIHDGAPRSAVESGLATLLTVGVD